MLKIFNILFLQLIISALLLSCSSQSVKKNVAVKKKAFPIEIRFHLENKNDKNSIIAPYRRGLILYFNSKSIINENHLKSARLTSGIVKRYDILLKFNQKGAQILENITRKNIGKRLGIFVDGKLVTAPTILQAIPGGTAMISGVFKAEKAKDIVQKIQEGLKKKLKNRK